MPNYMFTDLKSISKTLVFETKGEMLFQNLSAHSHSPKSLLYTDSVSLSQNEQRSDCVISIDLSNLQVAQSLFKKLIANMIPYII